VIYTSLKQYPYLQRGGTLAAGAVAKANAYRVPLNYTRYATPTAVSWYLSNGAYYVTIDCHANYDGYVALPPEWVGKTVTLVSKHANVTVNSTTVAKAGISVTIINNIGWVTVKVL